MLKSNQYIEHVVDVFCAQLIISIMLFIRLLDAYSLISQNHSAAGKIIQHFKK